MLGGWLRVFHAARPNRLMGEVSSTFVVPGGATCPMLILLGAAILVFTFYPLLAQFHPADDYSIYTYFAEATSEGYNPYSLPDTFRSEVVPKFFAVGWTQPSLGVVRQQYADYAPLLMVVNALVFRIQQERGLYWLYIALYAISIALYLTYAVSRRMEGHPLGANPVLVLLFLGLNPLVQKTWFAPIHDKVWFAFLMLAVLVCRNRPALLAVCLGFFAALKGVGVFSLVFYVLYLTQQGQVSGRRIAPFLLLFALVVLVSHLPWFPDWTKAYAWRAARQAWVGHDSVFVPLSQFGAFWSGLPSVLTLLSLCALALLTLKGLLSVEEVLLLPVVLTIIFNTELGFDRLLVAILAMILLARHNWVIVASYTIGLLMLLSGQGGLTWLEMWGWMLLLLGYFGWQVLLRAKDPGQSSWALVG